MNEILINEKNFESARKKIRENLSSEIIFCSDDDDLNRKILEKEKISVLLINLTKRKDFMKQRNSGFNHVLAKIAKQNGVIIGINFDEIIESSGKNKSEILARVKQNILLCNKNKLKMRFIILKGNSRNIYDLKALGLILGMPTWMTKAL
ncbi:MAG TPA: RNase P subunit p30 family protein [Candidatus Nanoarchaeia archaeon]|nr:RNase P subunit p30 family protein [Candidatus Nanoarchaeia archaeon]